jgi:tetratricopeptide (TPR) repeat protein
MEMGRSYATRQREDVVAGERLGWFRAAVAAHPHRPEAHFGLGAALQDLGDWRRARASYEEAIRLDPTVAPAHTGLGTVLARTGDLDGAVGSFREAIRLRPDSPLAHSGLAGALRERGDPTGAAASFREAIRLEPGVVTTHHALADVLLGTGDLDGALAAYTEAARFGPYPPGVHNNLAWLFATGPDRLRDGRRAIEYATRACELTRWQNPDFIATLAAAHAAVGDFDKAIEHQQKALSSPEYEKARGRAARERLELYRRRRPYYDPALFPRESGPPPREVKGQSFGGRAAGGDAPVRDRDKKRGFPEVKEFCDRSGKPLVHLPAGYGPNDVA